MKLVNFEVTSSVELYGLGEVWDLHNCVDFAGLKLVPEERAAILRWEVIAAEKPGPWGFSQTNPAQSCSIRFDEVTSILVSPVTGGEGGAAEARTLEALAVIGSRVQFVFMAGFNIQVDADRATLDSDGRVETEPKP